MSIEISFFSQMPSKCHQLIQREGLRGKAAETLKKNNFRKRKERVKETLKQKAEKIRLIRSTKATLIFLIVISSIHNLHISINCLTL